MIGARVCWLLLFCGLFAAASAQTTAGLEGVVEDATGLPVAGAELVAIEAATSVRHRTYAGRDGHYRIDNLAPGAYSIEATAHGFQTAVKRDVRLSAGQLARIPIGLTVGDVRNSVKVVAPLALLSAGAAEWGGGVERETLRQVPVNGRDLFELAAAQQASTATNLNRIGFVGGFGTAMSLNGGRPNQNSFAIDGIRVNDATGLPPVSAAGRLLGMESIEELKVATNPFSARYYRVAAAAITAISKSGTNEWHGSAYEYFRNSALDARNFFDAHDQPKPPYRRNQFGGSLGGPLVRDRLFVFVNPEAIRQSQSLTSSSAVPTEAARQGYLTQADGSVSKVTVASSIAPYLALYPLANGADFSDGTAGYTTVIPTHTSETYFSAKLDAVLATRWRTAIRGTVDGSSSDSRDTYDFYQFRNQTRYRFLTTDTEYVSSPTVLHHFRAGVSRNWNYATPDVNPRVPASLGFIDDQPMGVLQVTGLQSYGSNRAVISRLLLATTDAQLRYEISYVHGRTSLFAGAGYSNLQANPTLDVNRRGQYIFTSLAGLLTGQPAAANVTTPASISSRTLTQHLGNAYFQYERRTSPSLSLSAGVVYEPYTAPTERHGGLGMMSFPATAPTVETGGAMFRNPSRLNFAPRAALAWNPGGSGNTVVRAGFGVFYDMLGPTVYVANRAYSPQQYTNVTLIRPSFPNLLSSLAALKSAPSLSMVDYDVQQPYVMQYQLAVERQFGGNTVISATYAGSRGVHLVGLVGDVNPPAPQVLADGSLYFPTGSLPANSAFGQIGMLRTQFNSFYNALLLRVDRQLAGGFRLHANYSFSKTIDETSDVLFQDFLNSDKVPTMFDYRSNRGRADFSLTHALSMNFSYLVPWRGHGVSRRLLGDWELHGLLQMQSGRPFGPSVGFDRAGFRSLDDLGQRPNDTGASGASVITGSPDQYFDVTAYSLPAAGTYGNLGRNTLTGPGLVTLDAAAQKLLWCSERHRVTARFEAFNLTNRPNFQIPANVALFSSSGARNGAAGRITSTTTPSRQLQVALRWTF